ncbi:MAG: hypothetical protein PHI40_00255 [Caldisericia bacterium]|nr:hypothetical protein [Caldisericia bacterium]
MAYIAKSAGTLRKIRGSLLEKIAGELALIDAEIDSVGVQAATHRSKFVLLTAGLGTRSDAATSGVDIADGTGGTTFGVFFAPVAITAVKLHVLANEAYAKDTTDTTDAKIEIKDNSTTPVVIFTHTPAADGVAAGTLASTSPATGKAAIAAGKRLDLVVTATGSSDGTGHVDVILEYYETES